MDKKFTKILIVVGTFVALAMSFSLGWGVCLLQASPNTNESTIEKAVADAVADSSATVEKKVAEATKDIQDELEEKTAELKKVKSELKEKKAKATSDATSSIIKEDIYQEVVETIFYDIPGDFIMKNPEFKFYSNRSCTPDTLITDELNFITHRDVDGRNSSGFEVFISMSSQGPVYSTEKPYFDPAN